MSPGRRGAAARKPCRPLDWWYWLATAALLSAALFGWRAMLACTIALAAVQIGHFAVRTGSLASFPVQVRGAYLALLLLGLWPPLSVVHWVQFVGTWAMVLTGYCFLARCLSLLPWNRQARPSVQVVVRTFLSRPVKGSILRHAPAAPGPPGRSR